MHIQEARAILRNVLEALAGLHERGLLTQRQARNIIVRALFRVSAFFCRRRRR